MHPVRRIALFVLCAVVVCSPAAGGAELPTTTDPEVDRLVGLCKAWTATKFLHPWMFSGGPERNRDWDRAFVEAVSAVRSAEGVEEYRVAVDGMLGTLGDPVTEVVPVSVDRPEDAEDATEGEEGDAARDAGSDEPPPLFRRPAQGIVLMDVVRYQAAAGFNRLVRKVRSGALDQALGGAAGVIVDLRSPPRTTVDPDLIVYVLTHAGPKLIPPGASPEIRGPVDRWPVHWGYRPQAGATSGGYHSGFVSSHAQAFVPESSAGAAGAKPEKIVFLADERTVLPEVALALRGAGYARIVSEAPLSASRLAESHSVDLGEGVTAQIRTTELVPTEHAPFGVDRIVDPATSSEADSGSDPALAAALDLLEEPFGPVAGEGATDAEPLPPGVWRPDETYPDMRAPDAAHRMLAGCRLWGVIEHFYPYLHLIGDWEGAFREAIPELLAEPAPEEAEEAYVRAILRFAAAIEDSHTGVWGEAVSALRGGAGPPLRFRETPDRQGRARWAITEVRDRALQERLRVGDVLHAVDGVPVEERLEAARPLVTASSEGARRRRALGWSLAGEEDSDVTLTVSGADGRRRDVAVRRGRPEEPPEPEEGPPYRLLEGEDGLGVCAAGPRRLLGYVDLMRLEVPQVDALFESLGETDGMIFDLRGYPRGTAWALAPRINDRGAEVGARFRRREVSRFGLHWADSGYFFTQPLPERPEGVEPYRGEIVVLIDERAISQSEHSALFFEAAADVTFVGTPTAGANGDVTNLTLPGGLSVYFTGHDVRWPDGRRLQRVGVLPDVEVAPTLEGLRAGEDEVLEAGIEVLRGLVAERAGR